MKIAAACALVLLLQQNPRGRWDFIDEEIDKKLQSLHVAPADPADDFEFLRRVNLDLVGRLPKPEPAWAWIQTKDRAKLIDTLLDSPEYADYWSEVWVKVLLGFDVYNFFRQDMDYGKLREWLREQLARRRSYDQIVTDLLTAQGDFRENGPVNFLIGYIRGDTKQPLDAAVAVSRVFLGYQIQCAQCHDHPFDRWTKADFWSYTAMFARTRQTISNTFDGVKVKLVERESGELKTEEGDVEPRLLDGTQWDEGSSNRSTSFRRPIRHRIPSCWRSSPTRLSLRATISGR